jgi:hypothetical protein
MEAVGFELQQCFNQCLSQFGVKRRLGSALWYCGFELK